MPSEVFHGYGVWDGLSAAKPMRCWGKALDERRVESACRRAFTQPTVDKLNAKRRAYCGDCPELVGWAVPSSGACPTATGAAG
jgi:hypothetical protein